MLFSGERHLPLGQIARNAAAFNGLANLRNELIARGRFPEESCCQVLLAIGGEDLSGIGRHMKRAGMPGRRADLRVQVDVELDQTRCDPPRREP